VRGLDGGAVRKDDERLEVGGDKVYRCRDVVCVRDVYVAAGQGAFLCVQVSGVLKV